MILLHNFFQMVVEYIGQSMSIYETLSSSGSTHRGEILFMVVCVYWEPLNLHVKIQWGDSEIRLTSFPIH